MYSQCADDELRRFHSGSCCRMSVSVCRPRFLKLIFLLVVLLMMAQFSLNILFYRNYDSLFYVNGTSAEELPSFESRVRWVSSKLTWIHPVSEKQGTADQSHYPDVTPIGGFVGVGLNETNINLGVDKDTEQIKGSGVTAQNGIMPSSEAVQKSVHNLLFPSQLLLLSKTEKGEHAKPSPANNNVTVNAGSETRVSMAESIINNSDKNKDALQLKISSVVNGTKALTLNNTGSGAENKVVLLSKEKPLCPPVPPKLMGAVKIQRTAPTLEEQERSHPELEPGGRFRPPECRARHRVAIIIPYRDRVQHLAVFLHHMHPILQRQQIDYAIYLVEQSGSGKFNRAMLMNVGALEALKQYQYDCFIFHDVDLLPEDDRNLYTCPEQPRHMSIAIDTMSYRLPYNDIFGGVSAMTVDQFRLVNGFSNKFWGWGGEDDDMSNRIKYHGLFISRYPANIGRYTMLSHKKDVPNPRRYQYLYEGKKRFKTDGLTSAKYGALDVQLRRLYTWVYVDIHPS